jgi:glycosyltransferase involved in cell wall biosynthesis
MMRITFVNPVGVVGGAERVLLAALRSVPELSPTLILFSEGPLRAEAEKLGARVILVPLPDALAVLGDTQLRSGSKASRYLRLIRSAILSAPAFFRFRNQFADALVQSQPSLIHSNGLKAHLLTSLTRPSGSKVVWHLHDFYSHRPLMAKLLKRCLRGVAGAVAISEAVAKDVQAVMPRLHITPIRNAIDTSHYCPAPQSGTELDQLSNLPVASEAKRIGLVATYANWKGHDVFLRAFAKLYAQDVRAYIIGGPIYVTAGSQFTQAELQALAKELGISERVGFIPFQSDPADIYRRLDVVVHASTRAEPFGLTIAEAMSCGRPTIVAADGGAKELFTDGFDALGHQPGNVDDLAEKMNRIISDPQLAKRLSVAARATAEAKFSLSRFGQELNHFYRSLLSQ